MAPRLILARSSSEALTIPFSGCCKIFCLSTTALKFGAFVGKHNFMHRCFELPISIFVIFFDINFFFLQLDVRSTCIQLFAI